MRKNSLFEISKVVDLIRNLQLEKRVGICLDIGHFYLVDGYVDLYEMIENHKELRNMIDEVHLHATVDKKAHNSFNLNHEQLIQSIKILEKLSNVNRGILEFKNVDVLGDFAGEQVELLRNLCN
ncbi:MAG: hypothetical protein RR847_05355 [Bacilli bacterium]